MLNSITLLIKLKLSANIIMYATRMRDLRQKIKKGLAKSQIKSGKI